MEASYFLFAARRLLRTLRATAYPLVRVTGTLDDHGAFEADRLEVDGQLSNDWNPDIPDANIIIEESQESIGVPDYHANQIAQAVWENGTISGEIDKEGVRLALDWGDWNWDDLGGLELPAAPDDQPGQMSLPFQEGDIRDFPDQITGLFRVPDITAADFGRGLRQWLQGVSRQVGKIAAIDPDDYFVKCSACGTVMFKEDANLIDREYYCEKCSPTQCEKCGTYINSEEAVYDEDTDDTLCSDCWSRSQGGSVEDVWDMFNSEHPELKGALDMADAQKEMTPDTYITIFEDFTWNDIYGGSAWAGIAKTWRDMEGLVYKLRGGGGTDDDWGRLTATVDHAFDLVHNTGSLFTKAKAETQRWLFRALEDKYFLDPLQYRNKLSPDGRKLLDSHIRQSGGVREWQKGIESQEKVMTRVENALRDADFTMAERVFRTHRLDARDFYNRDSFLDVAFWQQAGMRRVPEEARRIRNFLRKPSEDGAIETMELSDTGAFKQGSGHPAAPVLRGQVLPRLLSYARQGGKVLEWLTQKSPHSFHPAIGWRNLLYREQKDAAEAGTVASALGAAATMIRIALKQSDFYDFYASTVVDPDRLPDDLVQYARGFKRVIALQMAKDLLGILKNAVIREARHVSNSAAIEGEY